MVNCRVEACDRAILWPLSSCQSEIDSGRLPGICIGNAGNRKVDARQQRIRILRITGGGIGGHHMRTHNGRVKGELALWDMAVGALSVIGLKSAGVVGSGSEIEIVVTGPAGSAAGCRKESFGLRGDAGFSGAWRGARTRRNAGGLAVANFATAGIGGIDDRRKIVDGIHVANHLVRDAGSGRGAHHGRQLGAHVDFMKEDLGVQRVTGSRIGVLGLVTEDAHLHSDRVTTMEHQLIVAGVATLGADDIARDGNRRAVGDEIEGVTGVADAQVE